MYRHFSHLKFHKTNTRTEASRFDIFQKQELIHGCAGKHARVKRVNKEDNQKDEKIIKGSQTYGVS